MRRGRNNNTARLAAGEPNSSLIPICLQIQFSNFILVSRSTLTFSYFDLDLRRQIPVTDLVDDVGRSVPLRGVARYTFGRFKQIAFIKNQ